MLKILLILMLTTIFRHSHARFTMHANIHRLGETHWQLFNECSQGMLQSFLGSLNTRGYPDRHCLTDWNVIGEWDGKFRLQHAQSKKFICFNKRARITLRFNGTDAKCTFIEEIHDNGFSRLRSVWKPELFLGFNGRGRFQNPLSYHLKPRCFDWIKLVRYVPESEKNVCSIPPKPTTPPIDYSSFIHKAARSNFLKKVSATHDSLYRSSSKTHHIT
ncbi:CRE-EGL-17 protein [Caenorhabditis remanei]|uniref:CRE-EGL-17 protein n=2 Tax=Caenorhabditis remanei TaxID=31234 RepID=E3MAC0_CAERE|nr:CRE-EGL-17 protein [Caenorhabditis remanei]